MFLDKGLADVRGHGGVISDLTVGSHQARKHSEAGVCAISLGVTPTSRVDVTGIGSDSEPDCGLAQRAATLVEQNLPKP